MTMSLLLRQDCRTGFHHVGDSRHEGNDDGNPEHNNNTLFDGYEVLEMGKE